ncbi:MAG: DUF2479 domain-containing protein [Clostridia bacterium]|nr:DUF2479 domain-containing protein [Clostridia bacterium]
MAQTYNRLLIDVNQKINNIVTAKQNDTASRFLDVSLYSNGVPINLTGHGVKIFFKKSDSTEVFTEGEVTDATAGRCQFELTSQTLAVAGSLQAEISIWNGTTQILSTQIFTIAVLEMLRSDNAVESTNEFGVLVTLFQNIQGSLDLMHEVLEGFDGLQVSTDAAKVSAESAETAVGAVSDKIGTSSDTAIGTVFGNIDVAKENIKTNVNAHTTTKANEIKTYVGGLSSIKSIQRGTTGLVSLTGVAVTISAVNVSKSFVVIDGGVYLPYGLSSTGFTLKPSNPNVESYASWQVIEFN